ncbi:Vacuolar calcium ion transporter [Colletotrichum aenigma]|uniref:Vacuolar calcium ion transporter n=1 Tax=Colletotrichum aenigma TaxID=1215731 RepID=UPI00187241B1|nr:Vacuolar calcium ion transporter [Colletotrichum aenigma]KAF5525134.1 Vacuolar calcium ion transporter [Colletotrichum aenigma]
MSDDSANRHFREQVRSWGSTNKPNTRDGEVDEESPLLNGNHSSGQHDQNGNGNGVAEHDHHQNKTYGFFLDPRHTPGTDSDNVAVRYGSYAWHITKVTLLSNYVNFLLVMVPIGIVAGQGNWSSTAVFTINFFAIIPLAAVLSFATEQISVKLGEALGGLLNATFGNAVELIVSIVALKDGQIEVVQSSMLGSILSNLLLVMGMCFFFGGIVNMRDRVTGQGMEQSFASATAQTTCSLMTLSSASLVIPATLYSALSKADSDDKEHSILLLSRGTAIILLTLYVMYLWFQLRTHPNLFDAEIQHHHDEEPEEALMGPIAAAAVLVVTTVLVAICAEYLVGSIDDLVESAHISKNFIGLILIPIVGNAAEHVTAVVVAIRNKMDLAMGVAIGSSIQIALLVTPFLVILGWAVLDKPMTLRFETFETVAFAFSVLVVTYTVQDGKSNYLEGAMLLGLYIIIALAFYVSPSDALDKAFSTVMG